MGFYHTISDFATRNKGLVFSDIPTFRELTAARIIPFLNFKSRPSLNLEL